MLKTFVVIHLERMCGCLVCSIFCKEGLVLFEVKASTDESSIKFMFSNCFTLDAASNNVLF